jgi:HD-GYP domain-containing protein (c-di-GMP phosphodiesterase class II)
MKISIKEVKPGMRLEKAVMANDKDKCLLAADTTLTIRNIEKLKEYEIEWVEVADRNTVFITPNDKIAESLVKDFKAYLKKTSPSRPEANKSDKVITIARQLELIIQQIAKNEKILSQLMELKIVNNRFLYESSIRASVLSGIVAGCMDLSIEDIVACVSGALLHDVGLCEMPTLIGMENMKPQEEQLFKEHPTYGYYFSVQNNIPRKIAECIQAHHERWDGSGYPEGLKGKQIPLVARIMSIVDVYDALTSERSYKKPYSHEKSMDIIRTGRGTNFDPELVDEFIAYENEIKDCLKSKAEFNEKKYFRSRT